MKTEYFSHKRKLKYFPIISLTKDKKANEKRISNKSLNSMSSSEFNSISFSSKKIKISQKNSYNNSDKSVKAYESFNINIKQKNKIQQSSEAILKKTFFQNLLNIKNKNNKSIQKYLNIFDKSNKTNILLLNKNISERENTNGNGLNLFNTPLNKNLKLKHFFLRKKKIMPIKKNNNTILKKFEGDFHNFYINSLQKTKNDFINKMDKINKTFYNSSISKRENIGNTKNLKKSIININNFSSSKNKNIYYMNKKQNLNSDEISYISRSSSKSKNDIENKLIKTKYSSQFLRTNDNYKRKRNFKQYMNEKNILEKKWKKKLDIIETSTKYNPLLIKDIKFQSGIIKDELCILLDDIQHFRFTFFEDKDIYSAFKNKDIKYQIKLNKMIEETCALLHLIPKNLLKDYYYYTDKYISITDPSRDLFSKRIVYNEADCFQDNLKYLYKILNFVNCCNEVYSQLIEQVGDEMCMNLQNFNFLRNIFDKVRHYMINITNVCKNILKDYIFDKHIITKFKNAIKNSKDNKKENSLNLNTNNINKILRNEEKNNYTENIDISKNNNYIEYEDKYSNNEEQQDDNDIINKKLNKKLKYEENFFSQKVTRIIKALEGNNTPSKNEIKKGKDTFREKIAHIEAGASGPMALINSPLMSKMLKYIKKDYKQQIISLRTSERFIENKI